MVRAVRVVIGLTSLAAVLAGTSDAGALPTRAVTTKKKAAPAKPTAKKSTTGKKTTVKKKVTATTAKAAATPAVTTTVAAPAVELRETTLGKVLVDAKGRTLYAFLNDQATRPSSSCTDSCAKTWPPLIATAATPIVGSGLDAAKAASAPRPGGSERQVTYGGWPLYLFAGDQKAGDVFGQGVGSVWFVVAADGKPLSGSSAPSAAPAPAPANTTATTAPGGDTPTTAYVYGGY